MTKKTRYAAGIFAGIWAYFGSIALGIYLTVEHDFIALLAIVMAAPFVMLLWIVADCWADDVTRDRSRFAPPPPPKR